MPNFLLGCKIVSMNTEDDPKPLQERDPEAIALGKRIELARGVLPRKTLGVRLGVHENTIGKWERGETVPTVLQLLAIARVVGASVQAMLGLTGDVAETADAPMNDTLAVAHGSSIYVPQFDVRAAAGHGSLDQVERVIGMRCFNADYLRRDLGIVHNELALVTVVGSSAEPEVHSGDVVLVDRRDTDVTVEGLHFVRIDHALMIKLLQRRPGCIVVSSRNESYSTFEVQLNGGTDFEVLGRCRWAGVTLR